MDTDKEHISEDALSELLKKIPQEEVPAGFTFGLRQKLEDELEHQEKEEQRPVPSWRSLLHMPFVPVLGAAVILALMFVPMLYRPSGTVSVAVYGAGSKKVEVGQVALLRVEFRAAEDLEHVTFKVVLPEGVRFVSAHDVIANSRALAFTGDVKKQKAVVIPVAVRVEQKGRMPITIEASKLGKRKLVLEGRASLE